MPAAPSVSNMHEPWSSAGGGTPEHRGVRRRVAVHQIAPLSFTELKTLLSKGFTNPEVRGQFTVVFCTGLRPGEQIGRVSKPLGHTGDKMVIRHYAKSIPNLTRKDGSVLTRVMKDQGLR